MCQSYHICLEFPGLISILNVWRNKTVYSRVVSSRVVRGSTGDWGVTGTELSLTVGHTGGSYQPLYTPRRHDNDIHLTALYKQYPGNTETSHQ